MDNELREKILEDKQYYYGDAWKCLYRRLTHNPLYWRGKYIITSRKVGYYAKKNSVICKLLWLYHIRRKNILGEKLGIELGPNEFGRRIKIYHNNVVINAGVTIGDDCEFYGENCIGNKGSGFEPLAAPIVGNRVSFGVGANAIGRVHICDDVQVSSMSLVNKDIENPGIYGGIPVMMLKKLY